ncbi:hypothetical protein WR25_20846 [Diploscapter pachys]|uniref:Uncharacterized protein n=1 Tax=Diploscapter pachys TaxID=2018661 RepID=A0A2A2JPC4_9BILA|nr:hypothetical protein WR25_20846 [Diploscapter pachys]
MKIMVDERAQWMKEHYIAFENGSKIYYWPDENGVWQMEGLGVWHEHMLNQEIRYEYGVGSAWLNYCFPRDFIPEEEWLASIFRSMQHKASVQALLRTAVLLCMTNGIMKCLCFASRFAIQSTSVVSWLIVYIYPSNEVFHSLSLFAITELQLYQDDKYFFLVQPAFFVFTITLLMKLIVNSIMEGLNYLTLIRLLCIPIVCFSYFTIIEDIEKYVDHPNCDAQEIGVVVEVGHGLVERALQDVPMVLEQPQHNAPHRCSEPGKYGEL